MGFVCEMADVSLFLGRRIGAGRVGGVPCRPVHQEHFRAYQ